MSRLNEFSAVAAAAEMAAGRLTAEHLTRACLERIVERENDVRAWAYLSPDRVIAEARARDREPRRGPLHGMPIAVKDVNLAKDGVGGVGPYEVKADRAKHTAVGFDSRHMLGHVGTLGIA